MGAVTVQEALDDICGRFDAADISYHANCPGLADAKTVQEALDLLCAGAQSKWPTVTGVSWNNDGVLEMNDFNTLGLTVTTSEAMNPVTTTVDTFRVVIDLPYDILALYGSNFGQAMIRPPAPGPIRPILTSRAFVLARDVAASPAAAPAAPPIGGAPAAGTPLSMGAPPAAGLRAADLGLNAGMTMPIDVLTTGTAGLAAGTAGQAAAGHRGVAPGAGAAGPVAVGATAARVAGLPPGGIGVIVRPPIEIPPGPRQGGGQPFRHQRLPSELFGYVATVDKNIKFTPQPALFGPFIEALENMQRTFETNAGIAHAPSLRARVTLKGDDILAVAGNHPPLDGEVMGQLDTTGTRIDFARDTTGQIRGGNGIEGGNFESWFFVAVPPRVADVTPANSAVIQPGQPPVTSITVDFTKPMNLTTITTSTFQVLDDTGAPVQLTAVQVDPNIPTQAILTLAQPLGARSGQVSTTYTVLLVGTGANPIQDDLGLALDGTDQYVSGSDFRSTFTVEATTTSVLAVTPSGLIADPGTGFLVTIQFSAPVNPVTVTSATVLIEDANGNAQSPLVFDSIDPTNQVATFTSNLTIGVVTGQVQFQIRVRGLNGHPQVLDQNGLPLNGGQSDSLSGFSMMWPLHATLSVPAANDGSLNLTFDKPLSASITNSNASSYVQITTPLFALPTHQTVTLPDQQTIHVQNVQDFLNILRQWAPGTTTVDLSGTTIGNLLGITDSDGFPLVGNQNDGSWQQSFQE
jgi:hypothetical protein